MLASLRLVQVLRVRLTVPASQAIVSWVTVLRLTAGLASRAGGALTGGAANSSGYSLPLNVPDALIGGDDGALVDGPAPDEAAGRLGTGWVISDLSRNYTRRSLPSWWVLRLAALVLG
ncbi:MAG: hypothetical protein EOO77_42660, partial [Oxalobacteraceae bacterium]